MTQAQELKVAALAVILASLAIVFVVPFAIAVVAFFAGL